MRTTTKSLAAGFCVAGLLLAGCGSSSDGASDDDTEASSQATEDITISDAWARTSPMGTSAGAVYMEITASEDDQLIGASVPTSVAGTTEVHETTMEDMSDDEMSDDMDMDDESTDTTMGDDMDMDEDMGDDDMDMGNMTMQQVESIELPAGETVALEPGGYHIMLLDLVEPLEAGQTIEVTLEFENAGTKTVTAEVRDA